jgi:hypothetical protein
VQDMKETITLIRKRMLTPQSRQKIYADKYRHKLEFMGRMFGVLATRGSLVQAMLDHSKC